MFPAFLNESLGHVAAIPNECARHALGQGRDGLAVVDVARGQASRSPRCSVNPSNQPMAVLPRRATGLKTV